MECKSSWQYDRKGVWNINYYVKIRNVIIFSNELYCFSNNSIASSRKFHPNHKSQTDIISSVTILAQSSPGLCTLAFIYSSLHILLWSRKTLHIHETSMISLGLLLCQTHMVLPWKFHEPAHIINAFLIRARNLSARLISSKTFWLFAAERIIKELTWERFQRPKQRIVWSALWQNGSSRIAPND